MLLKGEIEGGSVQPRSNPPLAASTGRFLQTDPVGYEDQINLYGYVGGDPINLVDPSGECEEAPGANGATVRIGICASTAAEQALINDMIADPLSEVSSVEAQALKLEQRVDFSFGTHQTDRSNGSQVEVLGGRTQETGYADGSRLIEVAVDPNDEVTVRGVDTSGRAADHVLTTKEIVEHEMVSHALKYLAGSQQTPAGSIQADNRNFQRRGVDFRRTRHNDLLRVRPRRSR